MTTDTRFRQRDKRYPVLRPAAAFIEFHFGRRPWKLPLLDLSVGGLSFRTTDEAPGVAAGARLESVLHVGDCQMRGVVIVRHATEQTDTTVHYGGVFYPAEEGDLLKLNGVLGGIDTISPR
ncbi:MAG TPA: PilZ domain-containing protein [Candidatus Polarisedimenticolaceae bacterium]|nr:PilZ domain-containing protein [Candidatus Polarisedimenticolaceae bacterium]